MKNLRTITFLSLTLLLSVTTSRPSQKVTAIPHTKYEFALELAEEAINNKSVVSRVVSRLPLRFKKIAQEYKENKDANIGKDVRAELALIVKQAKQNIEEDWKDIKVAAALSSIIRIFDKVLKSAQMEDLRAWLREVKYSVYTNTIHKLIMGLYPGPFAGTTRYTNAYVESLGYTANDWVLNRVAHMFTNIDFVNSSLQMIGTDKLPDMAKMYAKRVLIGILAHFTWGLEKYACKYAYTSYSKVRG